MKRWYFILLPLFGLWAACEDVIEVETPTEDPRLVIEGVIRVDTTREFLPVAIRLSETSSFFGEPRPVSDVENIVIIMQFLEDGLPTSSTTRSLAELQPGTGRMVLGRVLAAELAVQPGDPVTVLLPRAAADGALDPEIAVFSVSGLFEIGLADHETGALHRNIQPANIRVHDDGTLQLAASGAMNSPGRWCPSTCS